MYHSKHAGDIPFLDHTNYHIWSSGIKIHLEAIGAFELVEELPIAKPTTSNVETVPTEAEAESDPDPAPTVPITPSPATLLGSDTSEAAKSYRRTEAKARGIIQGSCSDSVKLYLTGKTTARDMWATLRDRMDSSTTAKGRSALRKQFRDLRPVSGRPLIEYISHLNSVRYQLAGTDQRIDEETFLEQLLSSLPPSYDNLVEILNEQESKLSIDDVIRKLQQSEMAKAKRSTAISSNTASVSGDALVARADNNRGRGAFRTGQRTNFRSSPYGFPGKFPGNCNSCGEAGHKAAQCTKSSPSASSTVSCFNCGEQGHGTRTCPYQSLTPAQVAKGRDNFVRWKGRTGKVALAATTSDPAPEAL